jgi:hypothetical protein
MGTSAEAAAVDCRLSFADQFRYSKQTEVCHFRFLFAANEWKSPFFVSCVCVAEQKQRLKEIMSLSLFQECIQNVHCFKSKIS